MANDVNLNIFGIDFFFNFILIKDKKISILDKLYIYVAKFTFHLYKIKK
jgi:hypothetical protein